MINSGNRSHDVAVVGTIYAHERQDFTVTSQDAMLTSLRKILNIVSWVLGAITAISLLVGGIGMMNILLVSVGERTRKVGWRKAVGARRRDILCRVLLER